MLSLRVWLEMVAVGSLLVLMMGAIIAPIAGRPW
jgi:hypothetical protein